MQTVVTAFERSLDEIRQEGRKQGREQGIELGRVNFLRELAARKFGSEVAEDLVKLFDRTPGPDRVARAAEALLDCDAPEDFLARVREG